MKNIVLVAFYSYADKETVYLTSEHKTEKDAQKCYDLQVKSLIKFKKMGIGEGLVTILDKQGLEDLKKDNPQLNCDWTTLHSNNYEKEIEEFFDA